MALDIETPEDQSTDQIMERLNDIQEDADIEIMDGGKGWFAAAGPVKSLHHFPSLGKRYSEFLGKRSDLFYPTKVDLFKRWNEFVGKREAEMPFAKRYKEFLGKRQHPYQSILKRYSEFLG